MNMGSICDITIAGNTITQKIAKTRNWSSLTLFPSCRKDNDTKNEMQVQTKMRVKMYSGDLHKATAFRALTRRSWYQNGVASIRMLESDKTRRVKW
jgi:hypothetical protein